MVAWSKAVYMVKKSYVSMPCRVMPVRGPARFGELVDGLDGPIASQARFALPHHVKGLEGVADAV